MMSAQHFERIAVALSLTSSDESVLRYARLLYDASEGASQFRFIHALPPADAAALHAEASQSRRETIARLEEAVRAHFGDREDVAYRVVNGAAIDRILEICASWNADVVMVGHRQAARGRRSFSRRLAMKATCSVLMVPEGTPPAIKRIIAGIDLSTPSAHALGAATELAARLKLPTVTLVHAYAPAPLPRDAAGREDIEEAVQRFIAPLDLHGVSVDARILESGSIASTLVNAAAEPGDLLVVGTRGRSHSASVLLGSESEHVLSDAQGAVLVTKDRGARLGLLRALLDRDIRLEGEPQFG